VNVLLVPAHPGFPGQIPQSRKTVVLCVCELCDYSDRRDCYLCSNLFVVFLYLFFLSTTLPCESGLYGAL